MTEGRKLWYFYYADDMVDIWLDNMYGAMYDYVSGKESVRAVKYGYIDFMNQYTLAYQLMHHMYGIGETGLSVIRTVLYTRAACIYGRRSFR